MILKTYKNYNYYFDGVGLIILLSWVGWYFSGKNVVLFSSVFNFEKSNLYGILLALAPTLLGFVITSMSIVFSYLTSGSPVANGVRNECGNYIKRVFIYGKVSLSFLSILSLLFFLFDSSPFLIWYHYLLLIGLYYSVFSFFNIVLMMNDVMKLIINFE